MLRILLKSKLHNACITGANLNYEGSVTIDKLLMEKADILPHERVQIVNLNNGARFETYVIPGRPRAGEIMLNGPAARLGQEGDRIHIISYMMVHENELDVYKPRVLILNERNTPVREKVAK